jgi:dihydrodipicolinate synthase/N-acetylneuraminate lyase
MENETSPPPDWLRTALLEGQVIPAHPLALTRARRFDERRQQALTRYYHAAGAGGVALGVHTTQFEIREPKYALYKPVLELAAQTVAARDRETKRRTVLIAGVCGKTKQAVAEARFARETGYHAGLLSLSALKSESDTGLIAHCKSIAREIPLMGFYLQPAAGGRLLSHAFWRRFVEIPNVVAIKIAPFERYRTLSVVRAVADSGRAAEIALYTGNDDHIVGDLLTEYAVGERRVSFSGGLLGHWACWTRSAVGMLARCKRLRGKTTIPASMLTLAEQITDCNAAFFDAANGFAGCIPGIHEVLRRQGLLDNTYCLDKSARLSPGQAQEIDRVWRRYPELSDDEFVRENVSQWLK